LLHEVLLDIEFLQRKGGGESEESWRNQLAEERAKENPSQVRIDRLSQQIADVQATAEELRGLYKIKADLPEYMKML
jgi:hypothetical protein